MKKKNEKANKTSLVSFSVALSPSSRSFFSSFSLYFRSPMTADRAAAFKAALGQLNSQFAR